MREAVRQGWAAFRRFHVEVMRLRANPVPIPRVDPRSNPIDPFLQLSMDDLGVAPVLAGLDTSGWKRWRPSS